MLEIRQQFEALGRIFRDEPTTPDEDFSADDIETLWEINCQHMGLDPNSSRATEIKAALIANVGCQDDRIFATDFGTRMTLANSASEIEAAISRCNVSLTERPFLGVFNTNLVNGQAIRVRDSPSYIIAIDGGTLHFFQLTACLVSLLLPQHEGGGWSFPDIKNHDQLLDFWRTELLKRPEVVKFFRSIVRSYIRETASPLLTPSLGNQDRHDAMCTLSAGSRLFLLAHEYGHILAGHLTDSSEERFNALNADTVSISRPSWDKEYEADARGAELALNAMLAATKSIVWSAAGIDNFFTTLYILEMHKKFSNARRLFSSPFLPGLSDSHPPLNERRDRIFVSMRRAFGHDFAPAEVACQAIRYGVIALSAMVVAEPDSTAFLRALSDAKRNIVKCDLTKVDQVRTARDAYLESLQSYQSDDDNMAGYGYSLMALGELQQNAAFFRQIIANFPESRVAHYFLSLALFASGEQHREEGTRELLEAQVDFRGVNEQLNAEIVCDMMVAVKGIAGIALYFKEQFLVFTERGPLIWQN